MGNTFTVLSKDAKKMQTKQFTSFLKALIDNLRATGAVVPSSRFLANEMVSHIIHRDHTVLELGAGTGAITRALINNGISPKNIVVIENSNELVKSLRKHFPTLNIIEGCATNVSSLLAEETPEINTIVSSLPLRSLPSAITQSILREIYAILPMGGRYIQYTYGLKQHPYELDDRWEKVYSKRIWLNLPPARVDVWVKK
jgi:phospholipid N-methyltransferase